MAIALEFTDAQTYVMYQRHNGQDSAMFDAANWGYLATGREWLRQGRANDEWLRDNVWALHDEVIAAIAAIDMLERPDRVDLADRDTLKTILVMCQDYLAD